MRPLVPYALGAFIVVQLLFLFIANLASVSLYLAGAGDSAAKSRWTAVADTFTEPWAHLTGQEQYWRMFAPSVPPRSMFVRVRLHFGDEIVDIPSEFEPLDGRPWFHPPGAGERVWHVEKSLAAPLFAYDPDAIVQRPEEWRTFLDSAVGGHRHRYLDFLAWSAERRRATGDSRTPDRAVLVVSIHSDSRSDRSSRPRYAVELIRWNPRTNAFEIVDDRENFGGENGRR